MLVARLPLEACAVARGGARQGLSWHEGPLSNVHTVGASITNFLNMAIGPLQ